MFKKEKWRVVDTIYDPSDLCVSGGHRLAIPSVMGSFLAWTYIPKQSRWRDMRYRLRKKGGVAIFAAESIFRFREIRFRTKTW